MDNRANHQEKHPNCATTAIWLCEDREYLAAYICNSCYPETSVGEVVSPKSTLKHLFGTGKDNQVSLLSALSEKRGTVQVYRLDWSRMQKELQGCKNFCG
jgi:hypothetical protein